VYPIFKLDDSNIYSEKCPRNENMASGKLDMASGKLTVPLGNTVIYEYYYIHIL